MAAIARRATCPSDGARPTAPRKDCDGPWLKICHSVSGASDGRDIARVIRLASSRARVAAWEGSMTGPAVCNPGAAEGLARRRVHAGQPRTVVVTAPWRGLATDRP